ncbi:hypothetical protein SBOR_4391 [Sclerotinia borealis F-4128]|uniref:Uncharacterized protein n=1 Tax=Sclerotinia borealis (strain F-4128) TaxID=1432307 RepID=W9CGZ4_SCLBF|nr:hypothetical protein SBOR_4391 [Sclerotinia borealis F-4128]
MDHAGFPEALELLQQLVNALNNNRGPQPPVPPQDQAAVLEAQRLREQERDQQEAEEQLRVQEQIRVDRLRDQVNPPAHVVPASVLNDDPTSLFVSDNDDDDTAVVNNVENLTSSENWPSFPYGIHGVVFDVLQARTEMLAKALESVNNQQKEILQILSTMIEKKESKKNLKRKQKNTNITEPKTKRTTTRSNRMVIESDEEEIDSVLISNTDQEE